MDGAPWWLRDFSKNGGQAVTFFFVLSGFILTYSYYEENGRSGLKTTRREFWIARIARIYPVYALALAILIIPYIYGAFVSNVIPVWRFVGGSVCVPLLLQAWVPPIAWEWNTPAWSLSVEAFFYAVFPLFLARLRNRKFSTKTLIFSSMVFLAAFELWKRSAGISFVNAETSRPSNTYLFFNAFPLFHLPAFLVGIGAGRIFLSEHWKMRIFSNKMFLSVCVLVFFIFSLHERIPSVFLSSLVSIPLFAFMIISAANSGGAIRNVLVHPWLVILGEASYGIYILHVPMAFWIERGWGGLFGPSARHPQAYFACYLGLLLVSCILSYLYFERPARRTVIQYFKPNNRERVQGKCQENARSGSFPDASINNQL